MEKVTNNGSTDKDRAPRQVVALVYNGLCTFEYGIAAEVFGLARPELEHELYRFSSVAMEKGRLQAAGGLSISASGTLEDLQQADTIIIPGWRGKNETVPKAICTHLQAAHQRGARILSICSGGYVLAEAGLLDNKRATTHWQYAEHFSSRFPAIQVHENELFVDEGDIITSAGSSAGIDACLHIVRLDYGARIASMVARRLVMHSHRQGNQSQFIEQPIPRCASSDRISRLLDTLREDLASPHQIETMARQSDMSERTFQRRFIAATGVPAMKWLLQERVLRSCQLLETTKLPIEQISHSVGFANTDAMRYHFRKAIEMSPNDYRKRFSGQA